MFKGSFELFSGNKPGHLRFGNFIYICDVNIPWKVELVSKSEHSITVLEWDITGRILVSADTSGMVRIWIIKDNLLNNCVEACNINFAGERIIRCVFFHNGRRIILNEKQEHNQNSYFDKFIRGKFVPSVRGFGGVGVDGCLVVTSTGLLGAFLLPSEEIAASSMTEPIKLEAVTESLGVSRNLITTSDIAYGKNGQFLVAVANGETSKATIIQGYRVSVKKINENLEITSHSLPGFFLNEGSSSTPLIAPKLFKIQWTNQEDADTLLAVTNHVSGVLIEAYTLKEQAKPLRKLFQASKNDVFKTLTWTQSLQFSYNSQALSINRSSTAIGPNSVFVATSDNTIHVLRIDNLKEICKTVLTVSIPSESGTKFHKVNPNISSLMSTYMGHTLLVFDIYGQMYGFKCNFMLRDPYLTHITNALEYSLVNGNDYIDILLNIKSQTGDAIVDKLIENFNRQQQHLQQYFYVNLQVIKINIYRMASSGQLKSQDLQNLLMLHSILTAFKSLLRPSELTSHDGLMKDVESKLALALSESVPDIDKVLLNLDPKDFTVETYTLQSLQQLIQWVADLALYILSRLPEQRTKQSGYDISRDLVALSCLRELLVMIRIWGLLKPQCLPQFSRSPENQDVLATLFRLLTKLALNPNEPDEILLDECCTLTQALAPQVQFNAMRHGLTNPPINTLPLPLLIEYGDDYDPLKYIPDIHLLDGGTSYSIIDSVRYIQLGAKPKSLRKCTRCGAYTAASNVATNKIMKAWGQRWLGCRCNGFWQLITNDHN